MGRQLFEACLEMRNTRSARQEKKKNFKNSLNKNLFRRAAQKNGNVRGGRGNVKNTTNYGARISINCEQAAEQRSRLSLQTPTLVSLLTCQVVVSLQSPVYSLQSPASIDRSIDLWLAYFGPLSSQA